MLKFPSNSMKDFRRYYAQHQSMVCRYIMRQIRQGAEQQKDRIRLFRLGNTPFVAIVDDSDYVQSLVDFMKIFVQCEAYEEAEECKQTIDFVKDKMLENELNLRFVDIEDNAYDNPKTN
jgi:hypothetical protein